MQMKVLQAWVHRHGSTVMTLPLYSGFLLYVHVGDNMQEEADRVEPSQ